MAHRSRLGIPGDLRTRLEVARLDLLALFRALDRLDLSAQEIPQRLLQQLFERDANYAEALWALDQVEGTLDRRAMLRDTLTALDQLPSACAQFRKQLPARAHPTLEQLEGSVRKALNPKEGNKLLDAQRYLRHNGYMSSELSLPKTLQEAIGYFSDADRCLAYAIKLCWPNGVTCPRCESKAHSYISTRQKWFCKGCKKQFTIKVGTIMEDSPISLDKWMTAAWLICNCKNGISSYEIARDLGLTQKAAWFLDHRIRAAMQSGSFGKLTGEVEVDESFIGGKARNMHKAVRARKITGTGGKDKVVVMGMLERGGNVRAMVVDSRKKKELQKQVRDHVEAGAAIFSDELKSMTDWEPTTSMRIPRPQGRSRGT